MPVSSRPSSSVPFVGAVPAVTEVERIAAITEPVIRNLQITQCYYELSTHFAQRTGSGANWCTFATWASKQAGQTIRREDLLRMLEAQLQLEPGITEALQMIAVLAQQLGAGQSLERIRQSVLYSVIATAADKAGDAVSRGNKKVFEEIARAFARFMHTCLEDATYNEAHITDYCAQLRTGPPPEGQEYLQQAFRCYYKAFFEQDPKQRAELQLLANLQVGFHEQTRLQPEIAESLNAAAIDVEKVKARLLVVLFKEAGMLGRLRLFFQKLFGKTNLLDGAMETLLQRVQQRLRTILTAHLMTLTLPPHDRLLLGHDLTISFPDYLKVLANQNLLALLAKIDPTPDSLRQSGATDWADLPERMHFITDLFRCYHLSNDLLQPPFTAEQMAALKSGIVPGGRL